MLEKWRIAGKIMVVKVHPSSLQSLDTMIGPISVVKRDPPTRTIMCCRILEYKILLRKILLWTEFKDKILSIHQNI